MKENQHQKPKRWGERLREENRGLREKIADLKKEQKRLSCVIENRTKLIHALPAPMLLVQKGKIVMANESASGLFGYTPEELIVMSLHEIVHPDSRARFTFLSGGISLGDPAQGPYEVSLADRAGGAIICDIYLKKIRYEKGRATLVVHIHDLTQRKKGEKERCDTLKREAIGRMVPNVLGPLVTCTRHLEKAIHEANPPGREHSKTDSPAAQYLTAAMDECVRMSSTLSFLAHTPYAPSTIVPLDMEAIVHQAVAQAEAMSTPGTSGNGVEIKSYFRAVPTLYGHPTHIQLALAHIIHNAMESSPQGGVVYVTTETNSGMGCVYIQDSGPGISEPVLSRLFDPFFTTKPGAGRGLGLSLARCIVERHEGKLRASGHEGGGTTFVVEIPLDGGRKLKPKPTKKKKISDAHILFTGREGTVSALICRMLEHKGATVFTAASLKEGMGVLGHRQVDLIITDGQTPGMGRMRFIHRIKRQKPDLPVLLLNPPEGSPVGRHSQDMGPDRVLGRPLLLDKVVSVSADLISKEGT